MINLEAAIAYSEARGDQKINGFSGEIRPVENLGLEKGDTFTFPEKFDNVYKGKLNGYDVEYIYVTLANGTVKPFYPSTFTKRREVYDEDGAGTGEWIHTQGTAADLYRRYGSVAQGMQALAGKTLTVTDLIPVRTLRYNSEVLTTNFIPVIDIVK